MMKLTLLLILFSVASAFAEEEFKAFVNTFDDDMDTSSIESPMVKITQGAGDLKSEIAELPTPEDMLKNFQSAGLEQDIKPMNQMDRDILYMKVAQRDIASVKESYQKISQEKLANLKKIIEAQK